MPGSLEFLGPVSMLGLVLVYALVPLFPLLYVIIRWRVAGGGAPGLGFRSGLLYLRSVGLLVFVTGAALVLHSLIVEDTDARGMEEMRRIAGGLLVAGLAFWLVNLSLLRGLGDAVGANDANRVFAGYVMLTAGLATFVALGVLCVIAFQKDTDVNDLRGPIAWVVVWAVTWLVHVVILRRGVAA